MCPSSMVNIMSLKGKTLLITGASRGPRSREDAGEFEHTETGKRLGHWLNP